MGHNRNLADYAHHFDGTNIDLGSGNIETDGVVTYEDVTNVDSVGIITARAGVKVPDNQKVFLGTGDDLQIYHDGSNSYLSNSTGEIIIRDDSRVRIRTDQLVVNSGDNTEALIYAEKNGGVFLYHNASQKLETTTTGATVTGTLVSDSVTSELDLSAISSSISDTAVDVFVYDTRKDSDGGAWRKRTQYTSWYNETLNTATRGSRKEFPAVAVIVTETSQVTIYDGDDPDLPMWMVFNAASGNALWYNNGATATVMLNGKLANASGNNQRFRTIDFLTDSHLEYSHTDGRTTFGINISQRNAGVGSFNYGNVSGSGLINRYCNDVAMTVLPNAPIDDATGLPVPTIAVATDDGVSVIKDDDSVVDAVGNTFDVVNNISFDSNNRIICSSGTAGTDQAFFSTFDIPLSDVSSVFPGGENGYYRKGYSSTDLGWFGSPGSAGNHFINDVSKCRNGDIAFGTEDDGSTQNPGLKIISENITSPANGMLCGISTSFNTGWMHGDIKGAFLSDTDTTNITGSNLIDNGDFGTGDFTNWSTSGTTTPTISSGGALLTTGAADGAIWQSTSGEATSGKWVITWTVTSNSGGFFGLYLNNNGANGSGGSLVQDSITASGSYYYEGNITAVEFRHRGSSSGIIDNITLRRVEDDRSPNIKGLQVFGTVTKSAVETGADLVAYSGFSASNHLAQPYNSDLDPGSGSYSVVAWFKTESNNSGSGAITGLGNNDGDEVMILYVASSYGIYFDYGTGSQYVYLSNSGDRSMVRDGKWHQVVCQVTAGQVGEIYIDGIKKSTAQNVAAASTWSQWDTNYRLYIGCARGLGTLPFSGSISLVRYSLSKMSAEQVKKMYEDERHLFKENAKSTLYGSSDAVAALAYDEDTELLHVGTSAGRSDFQGLRRINNTTTAVTTAISASDELIAEQ